MTTNLHRAAAMLALVLLTAASAQAEGSRTEPRPEAPQVSDDPRVVVDESAEVTPEFTTMDALRVLMDQGYAVLVTEEGAHDHYDDSVPTIRLSAAEYVAEYESLMPPTAYVAAPAEYLPVVDGEGSALPAPPAEGEDSVLPDLPSLSLTPETVSTTSPPYSMYHSSSGWHWHMYLVPATDTSHDPAGGCNYSKSRTAADRFQSNFADAVLVTCYTTYTCFYANVGDSSFDLLPELEHDLTANYAGNCGWMRALNSQTVMGWVDNASNNGIAQRDGFFSVSAELANDPAVDWDHDEIVQHEASHWFDAPDRGTWGWEGNGIMNYWHASQGTTTWDSADFNIVRDNIWGCTTSCNEP